MHMIRVFSPVSHKTVQITDASKSAVALAVGNAVEDVAFGAARQHPETSSCSWGQTVLVLLTRDAPSLLAVTTGCDPSLLGERCCRADNNKRWLSTAGQAGNDGVVIGHGIGGKHIPIMARLAKARRWSKR